MLLGGYTCCIYFYFIAEFAIRYSDRLTVLDRCPRKNNQYSVALYKSNICYIMSTTNSVCPFFCLDSNKIRVILVHNTDKVNPFYGDGSLFNLFIKHFFWSKTGNTALEYSNHGN